MVPRLKSMDEMEKKLDEINKIKILSNECSIDVKIRNISERKKEIKKSYLCQHPLPFYNINKSRLRVHHSPHVPAITCYHLTIMILIRPSRSVVMMRKVCACMYI